MTTKKKRKGIYFPRFINDKYSNRFFIKYKIFFKKGKIDS